MSEAKLVLAIPSKGRMKDDTVELFAKAGLAIEKNGDDRGYQGGIQGFENIEVRFSSASEIAHQLKAGKIHMGVTGEDLVRETIYDVPKHVEFIQELGFGHADVVVAVPNCWLDVRVMKDLDEAATRFHKLHGRRIRVATKYIMMTSRFFSKNGVMGYRIVESLGATEGTPAAGTAELIVDITSTGKTLEANHLRILDDGLIQKSQANLILSKSADWSHEDVRQAREDIRERIGALLAVNK